MEKHEGAAVVGAGCYLSVLLPYLLGPFGTSSGQSAGLDLVWAGCLIASAIAVVQGARHHRSLRLGVPVLATASGCFLVGSLGDILSVTAASSGILPALLQLLRGVSLVGIGLFWIMTVRNLRLDHLLLALGWATLLALFAIALAMTGPTAHIAVALVAGIGGAAAPLERLRLRSPELVWEDTREIHERSSGPAPNGSDEERPLNSLREIVPALASTAAALMLFVIIFHAQPRTALGAFLSIPLSDAFCGMALAAILTIAATVLFGRQLTIPVVQWAMFPLAAGFLLICGSFPLDSFPFRLGIVAMFVFFALMGLFAIALLAKVGARGDISPAFAVAVAVVCLLVSAWIGQALAQSGLTPDERGAALCSLAATYYVLIMLVPIAQWWFTARKSREETAGELANDSGGTLELRCARIGKHFQLSPREQEILFYASQGYTSTYIAEALYISASTVRTHMKTIYRKTGVSSKTEMIDLVKQG